MRPEQAGIEFHEPDDAHREAAHLLVNDARGLLRAAGFTDDQIWLWAAAYLNREHSGGVDELIEWMYREQRRAAHASACEHDRAREVASATV